MPKGMSVDDPICIAMSDSSGARLNIRRLVLEGNTMILNAVFGSDRAKHNISDEVNQTQR